MALCRAGLSAQRRPDARNKHLVVKRLFQKIDGAELHGFDRERNIAMAGDDDHRNVDSELLEAPQQVDTAHARHPHVGDDAAKRLDRQRVEKRRGGRVALHLDLRRAQQERQRFAQRFVVVDDMNDCAVSDGIAGLLLGHGGQREGKYRAAAGIGPRRDRAAMRLDDGSRDRQPDAHAMASWS